METYRLQLPVADILWYPWINQEAATEAQGLLENGMATNGVLQELLSDQWRNF